MVLVANKRRLFISDHTEIIQWGCGEKAGEYFIYSEYNIDNKQFILIPELQQQDEVSFSQTTLKNNNTLKSAEGFFNKIYSELKNIFFKRNN